MSEDLIKSLRDGASDLCCPECCYGESMTEAAEEIERLRAQLTDLRGGMAEARKGEDEQTERAFQAERRLASARKALELARKRIEYYGTIGPRRHFDHDMTEIFPKIDAALSLSDDLRGK